MNEVLQKAAVNQDKAWKIIEDDKRTGLLSLLKSF